MFKSYLRENRNKIITFLYINISLFSAERQLSNDVNETYVYVLIINVVSCPPAGALIWKIKYLVSCIRTGLWFFPLPR